MRAARIPSAAPAVVAPSWVAVERVLYLAAIDRRLRVAASDPADVRRAYSALRRLIDHHAADLYTLAPVDDDRETVWIERARESIADGTSHDRAAVLVWAAALAWTDAPAGRWGELADAAAVLAHELLGGHKPRAVGRAATKLRDVGRGLWEAGR